MIFFDHIDGMYSLCRKVDEETMMHSEICHLAAWTQVEIVDVLEDTEFEIIRETIGRAGYGKDGRGEYREAKLKDMSDAWVEASIIFVRDNHTHKKYYEQELKYRKKHGITIYDSE